MGIVKNPYKVFSTEPDMRQEIENTLYGTNQEIPKGRIFLLRRMRTPLKDNICACVNKVTHEADKSTFCPYCWGEGYYWDELKITAYKEVLRSDVGNSLREKDFGAGFVSEPIARFFTDIDIEIKEHDKLVELVINDEGKVVTPYLRQDIFHITSLVQYRSDKGKRDYFKLLCYRGDTKFLNGKDG